MPKIKYGEEMDTTYKMRMMSSQKEMLFDVVPAPSPEIPAPSASEFWRDTMLDIADMLLKLKRGEITPVEFESRWIEFGKYLVELALREREP